METKDMGRPLPGSDQTVMITTTAELVLAVEHGALTEVPVYENHKRGNNWLAVIGIDPASPGGLSRKFAAKAHGEFYFMLPDNLAAGDALEFGADYTSSGGNRKRTRWYGVVKKIAVGKVTLEKHDTGSKAVKAGIELRKHIFKNW